MVSSTLINRTALRYSKCLLEKFRDRLWHTTEAALRSLYEQMAANEVLAFLSECLESCGKRTSDTLPFKAAGQIERCIIYL